MRILSNYVDIFTDISRRLDCEVNFGGRHVNRRRTSSQKTNFEQLGRQIEACLFLRISSQ